MQNAMQRLLEITGSGGAFAFPDLARELGVSETMLGGMLDHLTRQGYLQAPCACNHRCPGCPRGKPSRQG